MTGRAPAERLDALITEAGQALHSMLVAGTYTTDGQAALTRSVIDRFLAQEVDRKAAVREAVESLLEDELGAFAAGLNLLHPEDARTDTAIATLARLLFEAIEEQGTAEEHLPFLITNAITEHERLLCGQPLGERSAS